MIIHRKCPNCREIRALDVNEEQYNDWVTGTKVQDAFPELSTIQREFLITGICSDKCWDQYIGKGSWKNV